MPSQRIGGSVPLPGGKRPGAQAVQAQGAAAVRAQHEGGPGGGKLRAEEGRNMRKEHGKNNGKWWISQGFGVVFKLFLEGCLPRSCSVRRVCVPVKPQS